MSQPLITINAALQALASATTPDELITLANQAAALEVYARRAKLGMAAQNRCAEVRLRAERKLGQILTTTPRLRGRPKSVPEANTLPRLSEHSALWAFFKRLESPLSQFGPWAIILILTWESRN